MPYNAGYVERTFQPRNDFLNDARTRLERIFLGVGITTAVRSSDATTEQKLGLVDSRTADKQPQNKWGAVVDNVWGGRSEEPTATSALNTKLPEQAKTGIDATKARQEIGITARNLGAVTAPLVNGVDGRVDDQKLAQAIHKVAETNTEGSVTAKTTTAFDAKQENNAVQDTQQDVRADQSQNLFTPEEQQELQKWQEIAVATNFENTSVLTEWRNSVMTIYQQREQTGTLNSDITQELVSQVGAISARIERNNETTRTMTMQPA